MKQVLAKNFGLFGKRVLLEVLFIRQNPKPKIDASICLAIGWQNGLCVSVLSPRFLLEISILPLLTSTHSHYLEN